MIKILGLSPNPMDGTSWWRAVGPFQELVSQYRNEITYTAAPKKMSWPEIGSHDIMFIQRPYKEDAYHLIEIAKAMGVKVWLDYDDNLIGVPVGNPAHKVYADPKVKRDIARIVQAADAVTVTTNELASVMQPVNEKVYVIPNAFSDRIFQRKSEKEKVPSKMIVWRGSQSHDADLDCYMGAIVQLTNDFPDWKWLFMGCPYFKVVAKIPEARRFYVEAIPIPKYFDWLAALNAEIAIVPLEPNDFNKCKSNIAWQEFTYGGAACVVPEWPHWDVPGATTYKDEQSFYDAVAMLIRDQPLRKKRAAYSFEELQKNWMLSAQNRTRRALIRELVKR